MYFESGVYFYLLSINLLDSLLVETYREYFAAQLRALGESFIFLTFIPFTRDFNVHQKKLLINDCDKTSSS